MKTVSYTHLDVYKRQLHGFGLPCAKELLRRNNAFYTMDYHDGAFQFCFEWPDVACNSCAVSYTHLDVYKRQAIPSLTILF